MTGEIPVRRCGVSWFDHVSSSQATLGDAPQLSLDATFYTPS